LKFWVGVMAGLGLLLSFPLLSAPGQELAGADLARRLGCWACHSLHGRGGDQGLPLDGVGARLSREEFEKMLTRPRLLRPGARMPSYAYLPPQERQALVDFLTELK
jgi:cytochrome c oxidase subunit 2